MQFEEKNSAEHGVAGLFVFKNKSYLAELPESGEFVKWLSNHNLSFNEVGLSGTKEFGLLSEYKKLETKKTRPFNEIIIKDNVVIKKSIDEQGEALAKLEQRWYEFAILKNITLIPKIYTINPLEMECINGKNIYEYANLSYETKKSILQKLVKAINTIHEIEQTAPDVFSLQNAYYAKTMDRLNKIRDLIPFANKEFININGRQCRNIYYYKRELEEKLRTIKCCKFAFIHGDCTFSNIMLRTMTNRYL